MAGTEGVVLMRLVAFALLAGGFGAISNIELGSAQMYVYLVLCAALGALGGTQGRTR